MAISAAPAYFHHTLAARNRPRTPLTLPHQQVTLPPQRRNRAVHPGVPIPQRNPESFRARIY
jgi:hypothetical protein